MAQWLRIRLPKQGTRVRSLVPEGPTCCGATKPVHHNCWACALQPVSHSYWSPCSATREATAMSSPCTATKSSPCSLQLEKACTQQQRPNAAKFFLKNTYIYPLKKHHANQVLTQRGESYQIFKDYFLYWSDFFNEDKNRRAPYFIMR